MLTGDIQSVTRPELLQVADAVARDKAIDRDIVIEANRTGDPDRGAA